jgi:hypothetical protein
MKAAIVGPKPFCGPMLALVAGIHALIAGFQPNVDA